MAELAKRVGEADQRSQAEQGEVTGEVPLTPVQRWFFAAEPRDPHHWNMSQLLTLPADLDGAVVRGALDLLWRHHDALRTTFHPGPDGWRQEVAGAGGGMPFEELDLGAVPAGEADAALRRRVAEVQAGLDLTGPPVRALFAHGGPGPRRLLLAVHHLVVDGVSWRVLLEDLRTACTALQQGDEPRLPPKTTAFQTWSRRLRESVEAGRFDPEAESWKSAVPGELPPLPVDDPSGGRQEGAAESFAVGLEAHLTEALLREVPRVYHTRIDEVLLTSFALAVAERFRVPALIRVEGHGRGVPLQGVDVSRTVGWFTSHHPLCLDLRGVDDPARALATVKQRSRAVPGDGVGFGLLRWLGSAEIADDLAALPVPELSFNYLGRFDQTPGGEADDGLETAAPDLGREVPAGEDGQAGQEGPEGEDAAAAEAPVEAQEPAARPAPILGPERSPRGERRLEIEVNALVSGEGRLMTSWTYGGERWQRDTVLALGLAFNDHLRRLVRHCLSVEEVEVTPQDFPLADLDDDDLDDVAALLEGAEAGSEGR